MNETDGMGESNSAIVERVVRKSIDHGNYKYSSLRQVLSETETQ